MSEDCCATGCDVREGSCSIWQWRWKCCRQFLKILLFLTNHQTRPTLIKLTYSARASRENESLLWRQSRHISERLPDFSRRLLWSFLRISVGVFVIFFLIFFFMSFRLCFPRKKNITVNKETFTTKYIIWILETFHEYIKTGPSVN